MYVFKHSIGQRLKFSFVISLYLGDRNNVYITTSSVCMLVYVLGQLECIRLDCRLPNYIVSAYLIPA